MELWGIIENMVTEVSELFNLGINKKISIIYAKIGKRIHVILRLGLNLKTMLLSIFV